MCYKVGVRRDGHDEVKIKVDHKNIKVEEDYEGTGLTLELEYAKAKLAQHDPDGYKAILAVWPTVDELALYRHSEADGAGEDDWDELFSGVVTKLDTDDHEITVAAHMVADVPANPLTVDVQEDTDDPARLTVLARANNDGEGPVKIDFGDGSIVANPGDGVSGNQHPYVAPGTYTVKATSDSDPARVAEQVVTVPYTA